MEIYFHMSSHETEAQGEWTLTVSDNAGADTGKLNSWSIRIVPAP